VNVRRYKCPVPEPVAVGDLTLELRPLSQMQIDLSFELARMRFTSRGLDPVGDTYELEEAIQLLGAACWCLPEVLRRLYPLAIWRLLATWGKVQAHNTPDLDKLGKHLRWGVVEDPGIAMDGAAAYQSTSPAEFYGKPTGTLTVGQMAYFLLVRQAFDELHVNDKKVTKAWLQRMRQSD